MKLLFVSLIMLIWSVSVSHAGLLDALVPSVWAMDLKMMYPVYFSAGDPAQKFVKTNFSAPNSTVSGFYYSPYAAQQNYVLRQALGASRYLAITFYGSNEPTVGLAAYKMQKVHVQRALGGVNDGTTPALTKSGFTAVSSNANNYYGGQLIGTTSTGDYVEATFADSDTVGAAGIAGAWNVGLALISIDGDTTLADTLPTAQDVVTSGAFPNTILVANGGTLNPTDRVWDQFNQTANLSRPGWPSSIYFRWQEFSSSLTEGSHTVRITSTGYKNNSASSSAIYINCVAGGGDGYEISENLVNVYLDDINITVSDRPVWDLSYNTTPSGASSAEWIGHSGSEVIKVAPSLLVDGVATTVSTGTEYFGSTSVAMSMENNLRHSETGATNIGQISYLYSLKPVTGLTITHTLEWLTTGTTSGYPGMMNVDAATFDKFNTQGNAEISLPGSTGNNYISSTGSVSWAWDSDGYVGAVMYIPDLELTVDNWAESFADNLFWYDYTGPWRKTYAARYSGLPLHTFATNESISSEINYRIGYYPGGANSVFSGNGP